MDIFFCVIYGDDDSNPGIHRLSPFIKFRKFKSLSQIILASNGNRYQKNRVTLTP